MRYLTVFVLSAMLLFSEVALVSASAPAIAPIQNSAQEKAANLRLQLTEVETKQAELQTRLQALEENLKPENIDHSLAGVGSTHPEDLREQQRRQLEIERNGVRAQLDLLALSHSRLEKAIVQADADAYRQSAAPVRDPAADGAPSVNSTTGAASMPDRSRRVKKRRTRKSRRAHQQ
jgi:hypothetical protein